MRRARKGIKPGMDVCSYTGKRRFKSKGGAFAAAAHLEKSRNWKSRIARPYPCQECGGYHLSSQA